MREQSGKHGGRTGDNVLVCWSADVGFPKFPIFTMRPFFTKFHHFTSKLVQYRFALKITSRQEKQKFNLNWWHIAAFHGYFPRNDVTQKNNYWNTALWLAISMVVRKINSWIMGKLLSSPSKRQNFCFLQDKKYQGKAPLFTLFSPMDSEQTAVNIYR